MTNETIGIIALAVIVYAIIVYNLIYNFIKNIKVKRIIKKMDEKERIHKEKTLRSFEWGGKNFKSREDHWKHHEEADEAFKNRHKNK